MAALKSLIESRGFEMAIHLPDRHQCHHAGVETSADGDGRLRAGADRVRPPSSLTVFVLELLGARFGRLRLGVLPRSLACLRSAGRFNRPGAGDRQPSPSCAHSGFLRVLRLIHRFVPSAQERVVGRPHGLPAGAWARCCSAFWRSSLYVFSVTWRPRLFVAFLPRLFRLGRGLAYSCSRS